MHFPFLPKTMIPKLIDIRAEDLIEQGVRLLMLDFDNTVLPYTSNEPTKPLLDWVSGIRTAGIEVCVVSNSKKPRAIPFCELAGIGLIRAAKKPFSKGIRACLDRYGVPPEQAALVGDQIYTDVLGANLAGVHSILVKPLHLHNIWLKGRHVLEQPFILIAKHKKTTQRR